MDIESNFKKGDVFWLASLIQLNKHVRTLYSVHWISRLSAELHVGKFADSIFVFCKAFRNIRLKAKEGIQNNISGISSFTTFCLSKCILWKFLNRFLLFAGEAAQVFTVREILSHAGRPESAHVRAHRHVALPLHHLFARLQQADQPQEPSPPPRERSIRG